MTFLLHSSAFRCEGPEFAWSSLWLHIAGARHRVIYLFDYCPASWHVHLIDGDCVPAAAGLLVSPAQNSLKDSSARTPVTLFHFSCSPSLYHSFSIPLTTTHQFLLSLYYPILKFLLPSLFFPFFPCCWSADANLASDLHILISITGVYWGVFVCTMHECLCNHVKMKGIATLCSAWASPSLGDLAFISSDLTNTNPGVTPAVPPLSYLWQPDHRCEERHVHWTESENTKTPAPVG